MNECDEKEWREPPPPLTGASMNVPRIAFLVNPAYRSSFEVLRGLLDYNNENARWIIDVDDGRPNEFEISLDGRSRAEYDAVICLVHEKIDECARYARKRRVPLAFTSNYFVRIPERYAGFIRIQCDDGAVGAAAADAFLKRGFANFGFIGTPGRTAWSDVRRRAFAARVAAAGGTCSALASADSAGPADISADTERVGRWLKSLQKPVAVFAAYDMRARQLLNACLTAGAHVPEDVAILGVDDNPVFCETSYPQLASIRLDCYGAGYAAGRAIDAALKGETAEEPVIRVAALAVRRSLQTFSVNDPAVRCCLELIDRGLAGPLSVDALAREAGVSRRTLETRVRQATGRTIGENIRRLRVEKAKTLLQTGARTHSAVAAACGFYDARHLATVFKSVEGVTLAAWLREYT